MALGIDYEILVRRIKFLRDRARAHDFAAKKIEGDRYSQKRRYDELACAATLLRDAGAASLLIGETVDGVNLLKDAGERLAGLGLFVGYYFLSLQPDRGRTWWRERGQDLNVIGRALGGKNPLFKATLGDFDQTYAPFFENSIRSARQMLYLYQSLPSWEDSGVSEDSAGLGRQAAQLVRLVHERLSSEASIAIGPTGMPLASYLTLLDGAARSDLSTDHREILRSFVLRRRDDLIAAQSDVYHWKMYLNPSDLLDFDFLAILMAALGTGEEISEFQSVQGVDEALLYAPLQAARLLHERRPKPRGPTLMTR